MYSTSEMPPDEVTKSQPQFFSMKSFYKTKVALAEEGLYLVTPVMCAPLKNLEVVCMGEQRETHTTLNLWCNRT